MGQAKNRKAEILALKSHTEIKPFIRRADIVDGVIKFDTQGLDEAQVKWCEGVEKSLAESIKEMPKDTVISNADCMAFTFYHSKRDFLGTLLSGLKITPDEVWAETQARFNANAFGLKSGDFIPLAVSSECIAPSVTEDYKIKANNDWFLQMYTALGDNGRLQSPDGMYPPLKVDKVRRGWVVV